MFNVVTAVSLAATKQCSLLKITLLFCTSMNVSAEKHKDFHNFGFTYAGEVDKLGC